MRELNWPKHLASRPSAFRQRGLLAAGVGVLALGGLAVWLHDRTTAEADVPKVAQRPTAPVLPQAIVTAQAAETPTAPVAIPSAEPPPPIASADIVKPEGAKPATPGKGDEPIDWAFVTIEQLRSRAEAGEIPAMEEMARRLVQGIGVVKDQQAGAGWLMRAAQAGSSQSAFNVGVMYERGFVVERDSSKAIEWYKKAVEANVPMARHNLALLLRDGKGAARNVPEAIVLLRAAAKQGMAASMFTLGDIYERGDAGTKDQSMALAWFAIAAEFERQTAKGQETPLIKTAMQRAQALQRTMTPQEIEKAQRLGQVEFKQVVDALSITPAPQIAADPTKPQPAAPAVAAALPDPPGWPATNAAEQVRAVQQVLFDLKLIKDKPDGAMGPMTRAAIRDFEKSAGLKETGQASKVVYAALLAAAQGKRDTVANSPLPTPPKEAPPKEQPKVEAAKPPEEKKPEEKPISIGNPPPPPPPPSSADIAKMGEADRVLAIQTMLIQLNFYRDKADGKVGPATKAAIRDYERASGLKETGEPTQAVLDSLKEMMGLVKR